MIGKIYTSKSKPAEKFRIIFNVSPTNLTLTVKDKNKSILQPTLESPYIYELEAGIYYYSASADEYVSIVDKRLEIYQVTTVNVVLEEILPEVSFGEATVEQMTKLLNAHYNGKIDISDYWKIGDTKKIHLSAISATSTVIESHVEQDIEIRIIDFNHDNLVNKLGIRTKVAITIDFKTILGNNGNEEKGYYWGPAKIPNANVNTNYSYSPRRDWLNNEFFNALSSDFRSLIKSVDKQNLRSHSKVLSELISPIHTSDKIFLLSYPEVFGTKAYDNYLDGSTVGDYEGTQYKGYSIYGKRKYINSNGQPANVGTWWLRSPANEWNTTAGYWIFVQDTSNNSTGRCGISPAFCI